MLVVLVVYVLLQLIAPMVDTFLQPAVNGHYPGEDKQQPARRLCATYARLMNADIRPINITICALGENSVWHMITGELTTVSLLMGDIRPG